MAQLVVRNLEESVKTRLKERAHLHGQSLEAEVRDILRDATKDERPRGGLGSEIAALFRGHGLKEGELPELRGFILEPPSFDDP